MVGATLITNRKLSFMKKILIIAASLFSMFTEVAQAQKHGIGLHFGAYDFYGPQTGDYFFNKQNKYGYNAETGISDTSQVSALFWNPMIRGSYWIQLSKHFDLSFAVSLSNLEYPGDKPDSGYINKYRLRNQIFQKALLAELDARINFNILPKEDYYVSPYIFAGINGSYHNNMWYGADVPVGLGFNFKLAKDMYINLESGYKIALTDHDQDHLQHAIGFVYWFKPGYKEAVAVKPEIPMAIMDMDKDGLPDDKDDCPTIAGPVSMNGCPDSDGDGINDKMDECPLVAGLPQFNGCPDSDSDGIPDQKDECPYVAGTADRNGCPVPDKDGDGFPDSEDRCPNLYSKTNQGCPEIKQELIEKVNKAARSVFFKTGKAALTASSFKQLDVIATIMKADPTLYTDIEGHTDNVGNDEFNMKLSQERADVCRDYLVKQGISADRITSKGFGETTPIATNETALGKAQNRRTEFKLRNYQQ